MAALQFHVMMTLTGSGAKPSPARVAGSIRTLILEERDRESKGRRIPARVDTVTVLPAGALLVWCVSEEWNSNTEHRGPSTIHLSEKTAREAAKELAAEHRAAGRRLWADVDTGEDDDGVIEDWDVDIHVDVMSVLP